MTPRDRAQEATAIAFLFTVLSGIYIALSANWTALGVAGVFALIWALSFAAEVPGLVIDAYRAHHPAPVRRDRGGAVRIIEERRAA